MFSAAVGQGAHRDGVTIAASEPHALGQALFGTGFSYDAQVRAAEARTITRVLPACRDIRCMGSAALDLCWLACGRLDGFYEQDLKVHDHSVPEQVHPRTER